MIPRLPRSLQASQSGLEEANKAFISTGLTKEEFANKLDLSRTTITNFLSGKPVDRANFFKICKDLKLKPDQIFKPIVYSENEEIFHFKQWILSDYLKVVAFLEIAGETYIVARINKEIELVFYNLILMADVQETQAVFLKILLNYLSNNIPQENLKQPIKLTKSLVNLNYWIQGSFESGWQSIEDFFRDRQLNPAFKFRGTHKVSVPGTNCIRGVKLINFSADENESSVALVVALMQRIDQKIDIVLQIHPVGEQIYLPSGLQLIVLNESEEILIEPQSRKFDNSIQVKLDGSPGECFSVKVALDGSYIIENFVI